MEAALRWPALQMSILKALYENSEIKRLTEENARLTAELAAARRDGDTMRQALHCVADLLPHLLKDDINDPEMAMMVASDRVNTALATGRDNEV